MSVFRATVPIRRSGEVPSLPHSVKLAGAPRSLQWPNVCASCGTVASERLPVTRVFDRDWRRQGATRSAGNFRIVAVQTIEAPVCRACANRHRQEVRPVGLFATALSVVASVWVIPLLVAALGALLYVFPRLLGDAGALVPATRTGWQAAAYALLAIVFAAATWYQTRPRRVTPPTSVTQSFDFSDNLASLVGVEHRVYGMENESFARAFRDANADRLWTEALREKGARREVIGAALLAAAVVLAILAALFLR